MAATLSANQVRRLRLRNQRLGYLPADAGADVAGVVKAVCGLQAQEAPSAALSLRPRSAGLLASDVAWARVTERSVVRTWCLRGTLHLVAAQDLAWLLPLLGPVFMSASQHRYAELGLDEATLDRGLRAMQEILAGEGPLIRAALVDRLAARGVRLSGQARPALIRHAALSGLLCLGPDRDGEPAYALLADWLPGLLPGPLPPGVARAELARRYLAAYGPATPEDLASWSGLPMAEARAAWNGIAGELSEVQIADRPAWLLVAQSAYLAEVASAEAPEARVIRLLPRYDTYLLGYRDRELSVDARHARRINAGGGIIHPTLLIDGRVAGTWQAGLHKDHIKIVVRPFAALKKDLLDGLQAEVTDIGRFLALTALWEVAQPED